MPPGRLESKFSSPLNQAFSVLESVKSEPGSTHVLCFPKAHWVEEFQTLLESLAENQSVEICAWSAWDHSPYSPIASALNQRRERLRTLSRISASKNPLIILASLESWIQPTINSTIFHQSILQFRPHQDIGSRDELRKKLKSLGYFQAELVEEPGQYALRGEILDIFDPSSDFPIRIEFFDTVVESIRSFHPETQRTQKETAPLDQIEVHPAEEVLFPWDRVNETLEIIKNYSDQNQIPRKIRDPIFESIRSGFLPEHHRTWLPFVYDSFSRLIDFVPESAKLFLFEPEQFEIELKSYLSSLDKDLEKYHSPYWIAPGKELLFSGVDDLLQETFRRSNLLVRALPEQKDVGPSILSETVLPEKGRLGQIREWLDEGYSVWIGSRGISHQERLRFLLKEHSRNRNLRILDHDSGESLIFPSRKLVILSESLVIGSKSNPKPLALPTHPHFDTQGEGLEFSHHEDLAPGDAVVHALHGVGRYIGLQEIKSGDRHMGEYLVLEYSGGDKLYLPVYRLNTIQRYVSSGGSPTLDKLGSGQFEKAKQKARDSARKLAINLVEIYAKRALLKGARFVSRDELYMDFCDSFEFIETEGQLKATNDVLTDLEKGKLLDRLVCGDVGFGKTEVAIRAAFQAVQSGHQVAVLVPTTLLAFQHEQSFKRRMSSFPLRIESLSRFKSRSQQVAILKDLAEGKIDILIGTHRLLSKDVSWNRLGLLIVDEEHRFGVEHKEKIKAIQANTHTLTLTATPIPRTLNMALSGLKDISVIKTPPTNRQPIKTFVAGYSTELVKTAIESELARGGQVFYLYNRVQSIHSQAETLQKLVPSAKILVAHGQMSESEIESIMMDFYQGRAQILVCTTIIESGIDVPNAGTILIHRADQLGLAQLYQIRGRVGRSHRKAFAYLMVDEDRSLSNEAKMRLDVLQRFVELGSGFQIASYDLEIRGGGNLLGGEQSGHIASIGLDLFTQLLEEAIAELRGQTVNTEERHTEPEIQVPVVCEISTLTVSDSKLRLSLYRKISAARNSSQVDAISEEFRDRFGGIPEETENLLWLVRLRNLLTRAGIESLAVSEVRTSMTVRKSSLVDIGEVMKRVAGPKPYRDTRVSITPESKIILQIPFQGMKPLLFELEKFLQQIAPKAFEITQTPDKL